MIFLFAALAIGLAVAAWINRKDRGTALFLGACCLLNLVAFGHALSRGEFRLQPNPGTESHDNLRPDRR